MNVKHVVAALTAAGILSLSVTQASAATLTFTFNGNGGLQSGNSMVFTNGGQSVTVTAGATALNGEYNINSRIGQYSPGLGNTTDYSYDYTTREKECVRYKHGNCKEYEYHDVTRTANVNDDSHEVDDWIEVNKSGSSNDHGVAEFLMLDFGALNVSILNVDFGYHESNDSTQVNISSNSSLIYSGNADPIVAGDFANYTPTNMFWFVAGPDNNNDWKLRSITVSFDDTPPGPGGQEDVPAPAALSLLGLGLMGLGLARRRRRV